QWRSPGAWSEGLALIDNVKGRTSSPFTSCSTRLTHGGLIQWACLVCVCRSVQSAKRAFSSSTALARVPSERSFLVLNIKISRLKHEKQMLSRLHVQESQQFLVHLVFPGIRAKRPARG